MGEEGRKSKVTIKTVAKRAGTSIATVSRVIHDNYPVSDNLRARSSTMSSKRRGIVPMRWPPASGPAAR